MTKRETLAENMRRLSNIVNEAEQLNEDGPKEFVANRVGSVLGPVATRAGKLARKFKPKRTPGLQNVTAGIIDDVISTVPIETAIKIDRMNRMGLSRDAKVKLMEIANQHLDKIVRSSSSQAIELVPQIKNDIKKVLKASIDADTDPETISKDMRKILRKYEQNGDLSIQDIFEETKSQLLQKLADRNSAAFDAAGALGVSYYAAAGAAMIAVIYVGYNDPGAKARRQARKDQDFYGSDDDAPLSQGEQGYRDQDLLWNDDNEDPYKY